MSSSTDYQKFGIIKLTHDNYHVWKDKARFLLAREGLWSTVKTPPPTAEDSTWAEKNSVALATIGLLISDKYLPDIRNILTAYEAWGALKTLHEGSSIGRRLILYKKLFTARFTTGHDIHEHILEIQETSSRLDDLGHPLDQEVLGAVILSSLPREFDSLVTSLEGRGDSGLTLGYIREKVIEEHLRLNRRGSEGRSGARAMATHDSSRTVWNSRDLTCYYCHKVGHIRRDCRLLKKKGSHYSLKPDNKHKGHPRQTGPVVPIQGKIVLSGENTHFKDPLFGPDDLHSLCPEPSPKNPGTQDWALTLTSHKPASSNLVWIVDSGAFSRLCHDKSILHNYSILSDPIYVTPASGAPEPAIGKGDYTLTLISEDNHITKWTLSDVLHVPTMTDNLISVTKLNSQKCRVTFVDGHSWMLWKGQRWKLGTLDKQLYMHHVNPGVRSNKAALCIHDWHILLGHRNYPDIRALSENGITQDLVVTQCKCEDLCRTCEVSKMANKKFQSRDPSTIDQPFKLIHSDLCGPIRPASLGNNQYILTMIDEYSGYVHTYLLPNKSDSNKCIMEYMELGINKFGYRPIALCTDNGGEYCNRQLDEYLRSQGIEHQTTVPYTPQENEKSERFNRTLMNCVRSLLSQSKLPKSLWGEMTGTATHLLNLTKSKTKLATPYQLWHNRIPSYAHLRVIGSTCYFTNHQPNQSKLSDRGIEGRVVGYGQSASIYRIWIPRTKTVQLSRSVVFTRHNAVHKDVNIRPEEELVPNLNGTPFDVPTENTVHQSVPTIRRSSRSTKGKTAPKLTYDHDGNQDYKIAEWYRDHNLNIGEAAP